MFISKGQYPHLKNGETGEQNRIYEQDKYERIGTDEQDM